MSKQSDARQQLKELADKLNVPIDELVGDLLSTPTLQPPADPVPARSPLTLSDASIRAAISDSYTAREIGATDTDREIFDESELIMIEGRRRLRLSDSARGAIIRAVTGDTRFATLLNQAITRDNEKSPTQMDEVEARSARLRRFLKGEAKDLASASAGELRTAVAALERLRDVTLPSAVPTLAETQRLLERAELLEPLRILIGATGEWDAVPSADRFVGRTKELRLLRSFVDEIRSETTFESIQRNVEYANQAIRRGFGDEKAQGVRFIVARGGLGKSALIAKFLLDHALLQTKPFPFVYLDFDRATIQARDPRHLLVEVARQVALQFPAVGSELSELRESLRQSLRGVPSKSTAHIDPFRDFRHLVRERITLGQRALLVVLDTVEIVQGAPTTMRGLLAFLERLSSGGFTELRIVAAGRAEAREFIVETHSRREGTIIKLDPLSEDEARDMVQRLGRSLLPSEWKNEWTNRLAGKTSDPPERREPLSLRVAVEAIRNEAPQQRDARSFEIDQYGEDADASFVGKLYEDRVVRHVTGGEEVRKLAWPGLVLRRVSVEIIRDLLAPLLGLDRDRAQVMFDTLATQVWIVVRDPDGITLRHEQDLRARTLPLMRRKAQFNEINTAAIRYFEARKASAAQSRGEWIYHRLLGGESPTAVDVEWSDSLVSFLKDAHEDFPLKSPAGDYLAARTSERLLPNELLQRLEPRLAIEHIARTGLHKGSLNDRTIDPLLVSLPIVSMPPSTLPASATGVRVSLLVKTGRWNEDDDERVAATEGAWQQQAAAAIAFRRARMVSPNAKAVVATHLMNAYSDRATIDRTSVATLIQDLAASRICTLPIADQLDDSIARKLGQGVSMTDSTIGLPVLRTAILFGHRATLFAARSWIAQTTEQLRANQQLAFSAHELLALGDLQLESVLREVLKGAGQSWEDFAAITSKSDERKRLDDWLLGTAVCDALRRRCERGTPGDLNVLRVFASARDEDWLVPLGYAAYRATHGKIPDEIWHLYEKHQPVSGSFLRPNRAQIPTDVLEVLRRGDEASDLANAARLFEREGDGPNADDLRALLRWYEAWRTQIPYVVRRILDVDRSSRSTFYTLAYPPQLRAAELACIKRRRERARSEGYTPVDPEVPAASEDVTTVDLPADCVGLALSGGGIRSATFCLGILQALARHGLLRRVDFLSTVSGGGYIGAFVGALIQRRTAIAAEEPLGIGRAERELRDSFSLPLRWLRDHGRYMSPNGAGDEITAAALHIRNLCAIHFVLATTVVAVLAAATLLRAWVASHVPEQPSQWTTGWLWWSPYILLPLTLLAVVSFPLSWAYWFIQRDKNRQLSDWVAASTAILIAIVALTYLRTVPLESGRVLWSVRFFVVTPVLALVAWGSAWIQAKRQVGVDVEGFARSKLSQWLATSLLAVTAFAAFALVDSSGQAFYRWLLSGGAHWTIKSGGLIGVVASLLTAISKLAPVLGDERGTRRVSVLRNLLAGVAAVVVIGGIVLLLSAATYLVAWGGRPPEPGLRPAMDVGALFLLTVAACVLSALCGLTIRFINSSSRQAMYGSRLTRAYMGASNRNRFVDMSGQRLSDPIRGDNVGWGEYAPFESGGPLHIVNVTLNETVLGASQIERRDRKGLPMAVGPSGLSGGIESHALWRQLGDDMKLSVDWTGRLPGSSTDWIKPLPRPGAAFHLFSGVSLASHEVEALTVGTWTAISGAPFSIGLGARTSLALSLLLGVANVRLGYWWNSHVKPGDRKTARTDPIVRNQIGEWINAMLPVQTHLLQEFTARFFGPNRQRWYLSDGGHFENTACYELLRRRVPFIIVCDDGQDVTYTFEDLANLVRKARTDLCADIRFFSRSDIETLVEPSFHDVIGVLDDFRTSAEPEILAGLAQEFSRAHAVLAPVYYEGASEPRSIILFIKPSITGDEPLDVLQYRQQHRAFPQESTADQYFDEAQWESYRALGEHIGSELFRVVDTGQGWSPSTMVKPTSL